MIALLVSYVVVHYLVVHYLIVPCARPYSIAYGAGLNGLCHVLFGLYTDAAGIRHRKQK